MSEPRVERLRGGLASLALYPLLALLSFPTLGQLAYGQRALAYAHDSFDLPRTGVLADWIAHGPTLWNSHLTAGNAILVQGNGPYALDVALGFLIGPFGAYAVTVWLLAAVAGISMHLFLRDSLRLSTVAAVGGATLYLFVFWHPIYNLAVPLLPLSLWLIDGALRVGPHRWRYVLAGSLVGAVALYQGLAQLAMLGAGLQLAYVALTSSHLRAVPTRLATWTGTWLLALGLFAPAVISQLVMLPISQRTIWGVATPQPLQAVLNMVAQYDATVLGVPIGGGWGASGDIYGTYFLGVLGLGLLALSVVAARRDRRARFVLLLLAAIPMADVIANLIGPIQDHLGFLKSFQFVRVRHLFPFALAANAAIGLDVLVGALQEGRPMLAAGGRWRWRSSIVVAAMAVPAAIALVVATSEVARRGDALVRLETRALGWGLALGALLIGTALVLLVGYTLWRDRRGSGRRIGGLVCLVLLVGLVGERAVYAHAERLVSPYLGSWAGTLGKTSAQAFLLAQPGVDIERVLTFGDQANRMGAVGLLQADGYQAIYALTYHTYFDALIAPQIDTDPYWARYYRQWGGRAITFGPKVDPEIVALTGVRWLYVRGDEVPEVPGIIERFHHGTVTVYEVPQVLPRAFVTGRVEVRPDTMAVVQALAAADLDALRTTAFVVDGVESNGLLSAVGAVVDEGPTDAGAGTATISNYTPDRVEVEVSADRPGVLVLTDVMAPGWIAERDGAPVPVATVDGTFRGVVVDPTTRSVVFRYVPLFTYAGFGLAIVALGLALAWALLVRRRDASTGGSVSADPAPAAPS
jgi:hypothetical protein